MTGADRLAVYREVAAALRATGEHGSEVAALLVEQLADGLGAAGPADSVAAELAAMPADLRAVAERVGELPLVEPPPGWEERALERWRAERGAPSDLEPLVALARRYAGQLDAADVELAALRRRLSVVVDLAGRALLRLEVLDPRGASGLRERMIETLDAEHSWPCWRCRAPLRAAPALIARTMAEHAAVCPGRAR